MNKKKLRKFFKSLEPYEWIELIVIIFVILVALMLIAKFLFVGKEVTYHTPAGDYTCTGGFIKACGGSQEVADYLGV